MPRQGGFHPVNGWFGGGESLGVRCRGVNLCGVFFCGFLPFSYMQIRRESFFLFLLSGLIYFSLQTYRTGEIWPFKSGCVVFGRWRNFKEGWWLRDREIME